MKKILSICLFSIIMLFSFNTTAFASETNKNLKVEMSDTDYSDSAYTIKIENKQKRMKAIVYFDKQQYTYDLFEGDNDLPLQFGNGKYKIIVFENIKDITYKQIIGKTIDVKNNNNLFVNSSQIVNIKNADNLLKRKSEFINEDMTDEEKINTAYNFIIDLLSYDYEKVENLEPGYIPNADDILSSKKGICYDYSVMMAVILRSEGIPTKINMGYYKGISTYHAWNEVYINGTWKTLDATFELDKVYQDNSKYTIYKFY